MTLHLLKEVSKGIETSKCGVTLKYVGQTKMTVWHTEVDCTECLIAMGALKTKTGKVITEADIEQWVEEAEKGYDVSKLKTRRIARRDPMEQQVPRTKRVIPRQ